MPLTLSSRRRRSLASVVSRMPVPAFLKFFSNQRRAVFNHMIRGPTALRTSALWALSDRHRWSNRGDIITPIVFPLSSLSPFLSRTPDEFSRPFLTLMTSPPLTATRDRGCRKPSPHFLTVLIIFPFLLSAPPFSHRPLLPSRRA